jgi:hypothetical protein
LRTQTWKTTPSLRVARIASTCVTIKSTPVHPVAE